MNQCFKHKAFKYIRLTNFFNIKKNETAYLSILKTERGQILIEYILLLLILKRSLAL